MTNRVILNNIDHQDLKVAVRHGADFGDAVNQMLVFPTEFEALQRDYPILFRQDEEGQFQSVVLLGLDRGENLYLDGDRWISRTVPAIQQRGPFSIGVQRRDDGSAGEPMIHVDLDDARIGAEGGQDLFLPHGGNTPFLEQILGVLRIIHEGLEIAPAMFQAFAELDLIDPVRVEIKLSEEEQYNLDGYHTISAERMSTLDGPSLERLNRTGFLPAAIFVLSSLGNVSRLIDLKNRKRAEG